MAELITARQLNLILGKGTWPACVKYTPFLNKHMAGYNIDSTLRIAAFIAQCAHETGRFLYTAEIYSGEKYDTGALARRLGNTPEKDGDGQKYKGRGALMITGYANYMALSLDTRIDFLHNPDWLSDNPEYFILGGVWYWNKHKLNDLADKSNFYQITRIINGGTNGLASRMHFYNSALQVLKV